MHTPNFPNFRQFDAFIIKQEIEAFLKKNVTQFKGMVLDIGCGRMPYKDWILSQDKVKNYTGLDLDNPLYNDSSFKPDLYWEGKTIPTEDNKFDSAMLIEVLEHCEHPDEVLIEVNRILKVGGKLILTVPFIFHYHDVPNDFNRFTAYKLKSLAEQTGFEVEKIVGFGNWNTFLAHAWALWIKRNKLPKFIRFLFYLLGLPFYGLLYKKHTTQSDFHTHQMAIGHGAIFVKK